jgi:two-component system sensor histidine kinase YesM
VQEKNQVTYGESLQYSYFRQVITNISLKTKLLAIVIFVLAVVLAFSFFSIRIISEKYDEKYYHSLADAMSLCIDSISEQIETYEEAAISFCVSDIIQEILSDYKDNAKFMKTSVYTDLYLRLNRLANSLGKINNIALVFDDTSIVYRKNLKLPLDDTVLKAAKVLGDAQIGSMWDTSYCNEGHLLYVLGIYRMDGLKLDSLATLVVDMDIEELFESSRKLQTITNYGFLMFDAENHLVYDSLKLDTGIENIFDKVGNNKYKILQADNEEYYFTITSSENHWKYACMGSYTELVDWIVKLERILYAIGIALIVFILFVSKVFLKKILFHFNTLRMKFLSFAGAKVEIPQYDYRGRQDELGLLHQQFDSMKEEITELTENNMRNMMDIKKVQIDMLQSQINPHFILNTLQLLDWRAKRLKDNQLNRMIEALGKIIKISLSGKESLILLDTEIDLIKEYIKIQQYRNPNLTIRFKATVDDDLMEYKIPKLSIQPIVENAFHYSDFNPNDELFVCVTARKIDDIVLISVSNSGSEFEERLLEKLYAGDIKTAGHGIGLINIDKRIKYTYSGDYGISVANVDGLATVLLRLPFYTGDAKNV